MNLELKYNMKEKEEFRVTSLIEIDNGKEIKRYKRKKF